MPIARTPPAAPSRRPRQGRRRRRERTLDAASARGYPTRGDGRAGPAAAPGPRPASGGPGSRPRVVPKLREGVYPALARSLPGRSARSARSRSAAGLLQAPCQRGASVPWSAPGPPAKAAARSASGRPDAVPGQRGPALERVRRGGGLAGASRAAEQMSSVARRPSPRQLLRQFGRPHPSRGQPEGRAHLQGPARTSRSRLPRSRASGGPEPGLPDGCYGP